MTTPSPAPTPSAEARAPEDAVQMLVQLLSPAYPVGAYSYSHGLEWTIAQGGIPDAAALTRTVAALLRHGAGRTDAMLLAQAWRAADPAPVADLAEALAPSAERHLETMAQGRALARTTAQVWGLSLPAMPYPVAVGRAARLLDLPLDLTARLFVQAFAAALVSVAVRLVPLGQTDGQRATRDLLPVAADAARAALAADPADLGGFAFRGDLAAMLHETQYTRLYRS